MDQAKHYLTQFSGTEAYFVFYLILTGCGIGLPFNSDFVLITASVLAALGYFKLHFLLPIAFIGLLTGDTINFFVARKFGKLILQKKPFSWIAKPEKVTAAEKYFNEKGTRFVLVIRFLPLIRTVLYFTAGSLQVRPAAFYFYNALSTLLYLLILMNVSFYASENIDQVIATLKQFQFVLLGAVIAVLVAFILKRRTKKAAVS